MKNIRHLLYILTICAALIMGFTYYSNVMMLQDGGWYTYPAYALLMGGDPSENLPGYSIPHQHLGITAKFIWENRTNLFVLHQLAGLEILGDRWQGIRLVGALEWLAIAGVAAFITKRLTKSWEIAALVGALTLSDSILIASALSNARPDVLNALMGLAAVGLTEWLRKNSTSHSAFALCILTAIALPLIHVTSAIAISLVGFYILLSIKDRYKESGTIDSGIVKLVVIGSILCVLYLFRTSIMEHLIPTVVPQQLEDAGRHNLINKLKENFVHGGEKLTMESTRWFAYFFVKNLSHLGFLLAGIAMVIVTKPRASDTSIPAKRIMLAVLGAALFQLLTDPHGTSGHLIVIMTCGYLAAGLGLHAYTQQNPARAKGIARGVVLVLASTVLLKLGQSYKVNKGYADAGFTNARVEAGLSKVISGLSKNQPIKIYGPTELWPYLTGLKRQITILDIDRTKLPTSLDAVFSDQVRLLAINEDYWNSGWAPLIAEWLKQGEIRQVLAFGKCSPKSACLNLYERAPSR